MDTPFFALLLPPAPQEDARRPAPELDVADGEVQAAAKTRRSAFGQLALAFGPRLRMTRPAASARKPQGGRPAS